MKAAVLNVDRDLEIKKVEIPKIKSNEVLVEIKKVGLCGSDIHYYENGRIGDFVIEHPLILGHEASGYVTDIGGNVKHLYRGDRVAIEPGIPCRNCDFCLSGRYNLCPDVRFLATPPYDGAFCEYVAIREDRVFRIPDTMTLETAALIEPFSVGLHAVKRSGIEPGQTLLIMGMGPIGLMTAAAAYINGVKDIIGVDFEINRLKLAESFGVNKIINLNEVDLEEEMSSYSEGHKPNVVIETAGNSQAVKSTLKVVHRGGTIAIVGMPPEDVAELNISKIVGMELDVRGVFRYHHTYEKAIKLLNDSEIDIGKMITGTYSLDQVKEAMEKAILDKGGTIKLMIEI